MLSSSGTLRQIAMLKLSNVEVKYVGVILVLRGISVEVPAGNIVAILGANGAGKSTTLKAVSGLLHTEEGRVTDGSIEFNGVRIDGLGPEKIARMGIVQILEGRRVLEHLTVEENLNLGAYTRSDKKAIATDLGRVYDYFPRLWACSRQIAGTLSGGEQQMLAIGRALMGRPRLLLLDEPSLGLAPLIVRDLFKIIRTINEQDKVTILLVEQDAKLALSVASFGYVLETGRIAVAEPAAQLSSNENIRKSYLGY